MSVSGGVPFWKAIGLAAEMPLDCELGKEELRAILVCSGKLLVYVESGTSILIY
jgi:hypothetical protein